MLKPYYDSRNPGCKTPFGAVAAMTEVTLTLHLPKTQAFDKVVLMLFEMDHWEEPMVLPMELLGFDPLYNLYSCRFTPETPCLYAYHFEFLSDGRMLQLRRGRDGRGVTDGQGDLWQLTVYDRGMKCPAFLREGVLYQIFPDRFARSGAAHENIPWGRTLREDWGGIPEWRPNGNGEVTMSDFFQGDLKGIEEKLDYLESLGVTALYLNPIFEAHANHRYNTADYEKVDPLLGTNDDFAALTEAARRRGIRVVLDGVFSHTGSDSVYFNKERRYGDGGAYNDQNSPYSPWYRFDEFPHRYDSWWGFLTLPNVNETAPSYLDFICGEGGVLRQWLDRGAAGFRLDVADELPDEFLDALHASVKGRDPDAAVIGEVWEDASNKESYGVRRRYLLGRQLDSVMNYPFMNAILDYIRNGTHHAFYNTIMQVLENYPAPAIQCLWNALSTHDTARAITVLAGEELGGHDRLWQEHHHWLPPERYEKGCRLFRLASILQFGLPGIPSVYYGDEAGLAGYKDPFNRVCYPWGYENHDLIDFIRALGQVRRDYPIFAEASFVPLTFSREVAAFLREQEEHAILFAVNRSDTPRPLSLPPAFAAAEVLALCGQWDGGVLGAFSGIVAGGKVVARN